MTATSDFMHSRRQMISRSATALAGVALQPISSALAAENPRHRADFSFAVINDMHYRDDRCGPWFERVVASIRRLHPRPAFVMLDGDLSESGQPAQLGAIHEIFETLPMPIHSVVGNHDCTESGDFTAYKQIYGSRLHYRFDCHDWQFLAFDSTHGPNVFRTRISQDALGWLDRTLPSVSRSKPVVVLTHFPLGRNWLRPLNAHAVLDRLAGYNFQAALGGHWHGITERDDHGVHLSTNRCCSWWRDNHDGSPLKGYALCHARDGRLAHEFVAVA